MINLCRDVSTCCSSNIHQKQADSVLLCEGAPLKALSSFWRIDNNRIASVGCLFGNSVRTESCSAGCGRRRDEQQRVRRAGRLRRTLLGGAVEFLAQLSASPWVWPPYRSRWLCGQLVIAFEAHERVLWRTDSGKVSSIAGVATYWRPERPLIADARPRAVSSPARYSIVEKHVAPPLMRQPLATSSPPTRAGPTGTLAAN